MKRITSVFLVFSLILALSAPVWAASSAQSLEDAVLRVKAIVDIPAGLGEFNSSSRETDVDGQTVTTWSLFWYNNDGKDNISAEVDNLGNLISYNRYTYSEESGLAKVSRAQGAVAAEAFLAKAVPDMAADMRQVNERENTANSYSLYYTYQLFYEDIPTPFVQVTVNVDKYTGAVTSFYGLTAGFTLPSDFESGDVLDSDAAKEAYLKNIGVSLKYYSKYEDKKITVFPAYSANPTYSKAIDAVTGETIELYTAVMSYVGRPAGAAPEAAAADGKGGLSPAEQAAVDKVAGLMSKEQADSAIRSKLPSLSEAELNYASLSQDGTGNYIWHLNYTDTSCAINAKTRQLISFNIYGEAAYQGNKNLTREQALELAEKFLKSESLTRYNSSRLSDEDDLAVTPYVTSYGGETTSYNFRYYRQVTGIDVVDNGLYVIVNRNSGMITNYSATWYEGVNFPSISSVISKAEAFDVLNESAGLRLAYGLTEKDKAQLIYQFEKNAEYLVDPFTGGKITYNGERYTDPNVPEYSDIAGHWCEDAVNELKDNGYYLTGEQFMPDAQITQLDFFRYLYSHFYGRDDSDSLYEYLERSGVVKSGEKAPQSGLSRQDAAKFAVRFLGLDLAGRQSDIYIIAFSDKPAAGYAGYAALCKALGIMQGDEKQAFHGGRIMTRAEAAVIIRNILSVGS